MRALRPMISLLLISGCAAIGSKDALVIEPVSPWKMRHAGSGASYVFSCEGMSVDVREIVLASQTSAFGPIVPVIPSSSKRSFAGNTLDLDVEVVGQPPTGISSAEGSKVVVISSGQEIPLIGSRISRVSSSTQTPNKQLWVQYRMTFTYDKKLGDIENLELNLQSPIFRCAVPNLILVKKRIPNNEFIITPGV